MGSSAVHQFAQFGGGHSEGVHSDVAPRVSGQAAEDEVAVDGRAEERTHGADEKVRKLRQRRRHGDRRLLQGFTTQVEDGEVTVNEKAVLEFRHLKKTNVAYSPVYENPQSIEAAFFLRSVIIPKYN